MQGLFFVMTFIFISILNAQSNPASSSSDKDTAGAKETVSAPARLGDRDPFSPPKYIKDMELVKPEDIIDKQMEAIRRWPLVEYKLKGIIWDVKNPKAMILDKLNTLHLLKRNYRIGNREGLISEINESEIVVVQKGVPTVLQIEKQASAESTGDSEPKPDFKNNSQEPLIDPKTIFQGNPAQNLNGAK